MAKLCQTCLNLVKFVQTFNACPNLVKFVKNCPKLSRVVWSCPNYSKLVQTCQPPQPSHFSKAGKLFIIMLVKTVSQVRINSLFSICNPRQFRLSGQPSQPFETIHPNYASQTRQPSQTRQSALSALKNLAHAWRLKVFKLVYVPKACVIYILTHYVL